MESVLNGGIPCNYELSWQDSQDQSPPAIVIRIHRKVATYASKSPFDRGWIERLNELLASKNYEVKEFWPLISGNFGFNRQLIPSLCSDEEDKFIKLTAKLPTLVNLQQKEIGNWGGITTLSLTLSILFNHLNTQNVEVPNNGNKEQLLTVSINAGIDGSNRTLRAAYSPQLLRWLSEHNQYAALPDIESAMADAYSRLRGNRHTSLDEFTAQILHPNGYLALSCPDSDQLAPKDKSTCQQAAKDRAGCRVAASKITSNIQLLTLLAGLAKLHDLARESIEEQNITTHKS